MAYDSDRFNGFAKTELEDYLLKDLWHHDIFNERDMHSSAYYYIRKYFQRQSRDSVYVRCEPQLAGMKPDIVIYEHGRPIYVLEFKFFSMPDYLNEDSVHEDIHKLAECVHEFESIRWGFFHMIHDCDESYTFSDGRLRRRGFEKISVTSINARRDHNGRKRRGYEGWRKDYDKLFSRHREHA